MKIRTKILLMLSIAMIMTVLFAISVSAVTPVETWDISAADTDSVTAYLYNDPENSGYYTLTISGTGNMKNWSANSVPWHTSYGSKIKSAVINSGVTNIGKCAFYSCTGLESITIPDSVNSIGNEAFYNCTALTEINFNATSLANFEEGNNVFYNAGKNGNGITVRIGKNVTKIPERLLCPDSYDATYSPKVIDIVFEENSACTSIGRSAFNRCGSLTSINLPSSVTSIGMYAFLYCSSLKNITIPQSTTSIKNEAFNGCTALTEINFNATSMADLETGNKVFYNAGKNGNGITVTIGKNVTKIPMRLLCPNSDTTTYAPKVTKVIFEENSVCTSIRQSAFNQCCYLTSINIPNTVTTIGPWAFQNNYALTSITIPSSVTSIENYAFIKCTALIEIIFEEGSSLVSLGEDSFCNCTALKNVVLPKTLTTMYRGVFYNTALEKIVIPNTVTKMGKYVFEYCGSLTIYAEAPSKPSGWDSTWNDSNRPVVWDYKNTIKNDVFTFKGYSFNESGSMAYGYDIDYEAKSLYEELTGLTLEIGVAFAGYDLLGGNQPLDENGEAIKLDQGMVIKAELSSYTYSSYDFMLLDISDSISDTKLVIAAYIYDGEVVKYVQENGINDTVSGVSYNEAKAK